MWSTCFFLGYDLWQGLITTSGEYAHTYIPVKNKIMNDGITYLLFQKNEWWPLCTWQCIYSETGPQILGRDFVCLICFLSLLPCPQHQYSASSDSFGLRSLSSPIHLLPQLHVLNGSSYYAHSFIVFHKTSPFCAFFSPNFCCGFYVHPLYWRNPPLWLCEIAFNCFAKLILFLKFHFSNMLKFIKVFCAICFLFVNK